MEVKAIIDRASDGTFACCAEKSICKALPVGYGDCAEEAKEDMLVALEEMRQLSSGAVKASEKDFLRLKNAIEKVKRDMAQVVL